MSEEQNKKRKISMATENDVCEITSLYEEEKKKCIKTTKRDQFSMAIHMKKVKAERMLKNLESINDVPENWQVEFVEAKFECSETIQECLKEEKQQQKNEKKTFGEEELNLMRKLSPHVDYPRLEDFDLEQLQELAEILDFSFDKDTIYYFLNKKIASFGGCTL